MIYTVLEIDLSPGLRMHHARVHLDAPQWLAGKTIVFVAGEEMGEYVSQDSGVLMLKEKA